MSRRCLSNRYKTKPVIQRVAKIGQFIASHDGAEIPVDGILDGSQCLPQLIASSFPLRFCRTRREWNQKNHGRFIRIIFKIAHVQLFHFEKPLL